ncbi:6696_t:CDS:2, partial [Dentiscutata erythropus]
MQQASLIQQSNFTQQLLFPGQHYMPTLFYNLFSTYNSFGIPFSTPIQLSSQQTLPTIKSFLKFQQKISVQLLAELSNEDFIKCDIDTIGACQTLRKYTAKYNIIPTLSCNK